MWNSSFANPLFVLTRPALRGPSLPGGRGCQFGESDSNIGDIEGAVYALQERSAAAHDD